MVNWKKLANKIPHRVQIASKAYYEVVWVSDFPDGNTLGETRFDQKQIAIKQGLTPKLTVTTFIHELCHAASYEHNINLTESQILAMEKSFYFWLKDKNVFTG